MALVNGNRKKDWDLSGRKLKSFPEFLLAQGKEAKRVDLQRNLLKDVSPISLLVQLRELNLSRNEIVEFPQAIRNLRSLDKLYMNQNNIKSIPENVFPYLGKLTFLKLSNNRLAQLPSDLSQCYSLTYLSLSKNCLKDIQAVVGLPKLKELFIERNNIKRLPPQLFQREGCELTICKTAGNPLQCPPEEVCIGGVRDIQSYFRQLELNPSKHTVWKIKTMFLGSSMAGKSTICRSLKEGRPVSVPEEDRTDGIEISERCLQEICFLLWDFAGQEEYYLTHHVFITPQALVILAVDLASYKIEDPESFKDQVWFWINNIQLRAPQSVVILVGTHSDLCQDESEVMEKKEDIDRQVKVMLEDRKKILKQHRKNIADNDDTSFYSDQLKALDDLMEYNLQVLDLLPIDCTLDADISKLTRHILKCVRSEDMFPCERVLPESYEEVERAICTLIKKEEIPKHGIVPFEDLGNLILNHVRLDSESLHDFLKFLLRYLHRTGSIVWYEDIAAMTDRVFIQPSFLISVFKTIIRSNPVKQLESISKDELRDESVLVKERGMWVDDLNSRGTLYNVAIRILVRRELESQGLKDDPDLVQEVVGTKRKEGILLTLLQHFEICLPANIGSPLNPKAAEFIPGGKAWQSSSQSQRDPNGASLFPCYLQNNKVVSNYWGEDKDDDLKVHVYFLPEIPHGFFHRLIVTTCSLYPVHWVGKDQCLLSCGNKLVLLKQRSEDEDPYIEIRCKRPENKEEFRQSWDLILAVMSKLSMLSIQWPGFVKQVHSPCPERGCQQYFRWRDWEGLADRDIFQLVQEKKLVCKEGHTRRTELIFPKVPEK